MRQSYRAAAAALSACGLLVGSSILLAATARTHSTSAAQLSAETARAAVQSLTGELATLQAALAATGSHSAQLKLRIAALQRQLALARVAETATTGPQAGTPVTPRAATSSPATMPTGPAGPTLSTGRPGAIAPYHTSPPAGVAATTAGQPITAAPTSAPPTTGALTSSGPANPATPAPTRPDPSSTRPTFDDNARITHG